jgi:hypothetical protein
MGLFAGQGANLAFQDVMKLADAILSIVKVDHPSEDLAEALDKNVLVFEKDMHYRTTRVQQLTLNAMTNFNAGCARVGRREVDSREYRVHVSRVAKTPFLAGIYSDIVRSVRRICSL